MHPLLFEVPLGSFGALAVPAFGALVALAFALGLWLALRLTGHAGLATDPALSAGLTALLGGVIGARLGFVALHPSAVASVGEALSLRNGGLSGTVGLWFGVGLLVAVAHRRGLPVATVLDAAAPSLALGIAFVRVGCWLNGCDAGKPLSAAAPGWLARLGTFPRGSSVWLDQVAERALGPQAPQTLPVHPSELYECVLGLALLALVVALRARQRVAGMTALVALLGALGLRVLVDFTRPLTSDVWCARVALVAGLALSAWWRWRPVRARLQ